MAARNGPRIPRMGFDLNAELAEVRGQGYDLHAKYLNPQLPRTLHTIGFDKVYERGEGAYLYDSDGNAYADFLSGFGVFAAGRSHPVIKKALHDALDADFAAWTQFDCQPISGLLAQRLLAKTPGLDRVFFCNSGTEAVESALKFARHATGKGRIVYAHHAFHGLTAGSLSVNGADEFKRGFGPLLPGALVPLGDLRRAGGRAAQGRRRGDDHRADPGPWRARAAPGFLVAAADLLHPHGALLICDEVQAASAGPGSSSPTSTRRPARHRDRRQGAVRRVRPGRRDAHHRQGLQLRVLVHGEGHGPLARRSRAGRWRWRPGWRRWRSSRMRAWWRTPPASAPR